MIYVALKALHVIAITAFAAGLLSNALVLQIVRSNMPVDTMRSRVVSVARRWDRRATTPALALLWAAGIALAIEGRWFGHLWLTLKLVVVVALSGLHGMQSGRLRRLEVQAGNDEARATAFSPSVVLGAVAIAIVFAVLKPSG